MVQLVQEARGLDSHERLVSKVRHTKTVCNVQHSRCVISSTALRTTLAPSSSTRSVRRKCGTFTSA